MAFHQTRNDVELAIRAQRLLCFTIVGKGITIGGNVHITLGHGQGVRIGGSGIVGIGGAHLYSNAAHIGDTGSSGSPFAVANLVFNGGAIDHAGSRRRAQRLCIVHLFSSHASHSQGSIGSDGQGTGRVAHLIVALEFLAAGRDGVGAYIFTLNAGQIILDQIQGFALNQTFYLGSPVGIGIQINLTLVIRSHSDGLGCHCQSAFILSDISKLIGYILAILVIDHEAVHRVIGSVNILDFAGSGHFIGESFRYAGHGGIGLGQRSAIIGLGRIAGGYHDFNGALVDGQGAFVLGDGVVGSLESAGSGVGNGIGNKTLFGNGAGSLDIGHFAFHEAVTANGNNRLFKRSAVIFLAGGFAGQRHCALGNGQRAVNRGIEGIVGGHVHITAQDLVGSHLVSDGAHVGNGAFHLNNQRVAVDNELCPIHRISGLRQGLAVIGLGGAVGGNGNGIADGIDHQLTGFIGNFIVRGHVVVGSILDLRAGSDGRIGANHGLGGSAGIQHRHIRFILVSSQPFNAVFDSVFNGLGSTIVGVGQVSRGNRHGTDAHKQRTIHNANLAVTRGHILTGRIDNLERGYLIRAGASNGLAASHNHINDLIAFNQRTGYSITGIGQRRAIIGLIQRTGSNGNLSFSGIDLQPAIFDHEFHIGEILIDVFKLGGSQIHGILGVRFGIGKHPAGLGFTGEGVIGTQNGMIQFVVRFRRVAFYSKGGAIIGFGLGVTGHGHRYLISYRHDYQLTVLNLEGDVEVIIVVDKVSNGHVHGIASLIGALGNSSTLKGEIIYGIQRIADIVCIAFYLLLQTIIDHFIAVFGDGYGHFALDDGQSSRHILHSIIALSLFTHSVKRIPAYIFAIIRSFGTGAGNRINDQAFRFTSYQAGNLGFERGIIIAIGLGSILNRHGNSRRGHLQSAQVFGLNFVVAFLGGTPSNGVAVLAIPHVGLAAGGGNGRGFVVLQAVDLTIGIGQRLAVVDLLAAFSGNDQRGLGHGQGVGGFFGIFVVGIGGIGLYGHASHISDAGNGGGPFAAIHAVINGSAFGHIGGGRANQRLAIIDLVLVSSIHNQRAGLGNGEGAAHIGNFIVALFGFAGSGDGIGTDVFTSLTGHGIGNGIIANQAGHIGGEGGILFAVGLAVVIGVNSHLGTVDHQLTIGHLEFNIGKVAVLIAELTFRQAHGIVARVGSSYRIRTGEGIIGARNSAVERVIGGGSIALHGMGSAIEGHFVLVTNDGHDHFVSNRIDLQPAVGHFESNVIVGGIIALELAGSQAHHVFIGAGVGALGSGIAAEYDIGFTVSAIGLAIAGDAGHFVAGHLLFLAIIGNGLGVTHDGHGHGGREDIQRAVYGGHGVVALFSRSRRGDGVCTHGRGFGSGGGKGILNRIVANQTLNSRGQGGVIFAEVLGLVIRGHGNGDGVVNDDFVAGGLHLDGCIGIDGHSAVADGAGRIGLDGIADGGGAVVIIGHLGIGALEVMMHGIIGGIQIEIHFQYQRTGSGDRAGEHAHAAVMLVIGALGLGLIRIGNGYIFIRLGGAGSGQGRIDIIGTVGILIVEFHGIMLFDGFPDSIEVMLGSAIQADLGARSIFSFAIGAGGPAREGVASPGEAARQHGMGLIDIQRVRIGSASAVIGMIDQGTLRFHRFIYGGEAHIIMDRNLILGIIDAIRALPVDEHHGGAIIVVAGRAGGHNLGMATIGIGSIIHRRSAGGNLVGHREGAGLGIVRIEGNIAVNLGIKIERYIGIGLSRPAVHFIAFGYIRLRHLIRADGSAVGNLFHFRATLTIDGQIHSGIVNRGHPLGIDGNIVGRHGAREYIFTTNT